VLEDEPYDVATNDQVPEGGRDHDHGGGADAPGEQRPEALDVAVAQRADIEGTSAVAIETVKIACGSWNRMKAAPYAVYPPCVGAASTMTTR